jgi:flagellar biosynthesis anti-sigma factor FlgM
MVSPISSFLNAPQLDDVRRKSTEEARSKGAEAPEVAAPKAQGLTDDVVELSAAGQKAVEETGFDQARVDAIRKAIAENGYPIDPQRIAEHFVALERMI